MISSPVFPKQSLACHSPSFSCYLIPSFTSRRIYAKALNSYVNRRTVAITTLVSLLAAKEAGFSHHSAIALDLRLTAPGQTIEEADDGIRRHAQLLLEVKPLLESESWTEAQKLLRKSSSNLKQDLYTIIQNKPGRERPQLRKLYSILFNNVSQLDFAARDKDADRAFQYYKSISVALEDILSRI
ncbi:hypothetical protein K2173_004542 [Erythroxylum novogranatense]|uniref:PsbQ-like protein 3, chloroplastic n=1 Tax=Erythroxylum novogranatense TaxID=1862640 RepID=A0AAV8T678_9ROSI|nr:hypothetical protein K2173_004542 [Erythroxylum novogranatense]